MIVDQHLLADRLAESGADWSVCIRPVDGADVFAHQPDRVLSTASVGKLLILTRIAQQIVAGQLDPREQLTRTREDLVADSGLWQHLAADSLPLMDLCALVGAVSDNLASNVLIRRIGLSAASDLADELGLEDVVLHDRVRDRRRPTDPPRLSSGSAAGLTALLVELARPRRLPPAAAGLVLGWLALNTDLSQVGSALTLDPLAHVGADHGVVFRNKTGTDDAVRADTGLLQGSHGTLVYAAVANWPADGPSRREAVLSAMNEIGRQLAAAVGAAAR